MDRETAEEIKQHFDIVARGLWAEFGGLRTGVAELRTGVADLRIEVAELRTEVSELRSEVSGLRTEVAAVRIEIADVKRHSEVIAEALRADIRTLAEGFVATNERTDRLETRMFEEFGDLKALIRLSFSELDRRIH